MARIALVSSEEIKRHQNCIAERFTEFFDAVFGYSICSEKDKKTHERFTREDADLYVRDRERLMGKIEGIEWYEDLLQRCFWADCKHFSKNKAIVFIEGNRGCGKSTILDYSLFCDCPEKRFKSWKKKLIINVNMRGVESRVELNRRFYEEAKIQIKKYLCDPDLCDPSVGRQLILQLDRYESSKESWVEHAFEKSSEDASENKGYFKYVVICFDNLDVSPRPILIYAIQQIKSLIKSSSNVSIWKSYIPLWPETLTDLLRGGGLSLESKEYHRIRLGNVDSRKFLKKRIAALLRKIENSKGEAINNAKKNRALINNVGCLNFIRNAFDKIDTENISFVDNITYKHLRRAIEIWRGVFESKAAFVTHKRSGRELITSRYILRDAMLTGGYQVHNSAESVIANIYNLLENPTCERDLLIGYHALYILRSQRVNSYTKMCGYMEGLGYTNDDIRTVWKTFYEHGLFHLVDIEDGVHIYKCHRKTINAYWELVVEDAYLDNMAMTTPVELSQEELEEKFKQTVSYIPDKFIDRVTTTIEFIKQVQTDEEEFYCLSNRPVGLSSADFKNHVEDTLRIPKLWKRMALSYQKRLDKLKQGFKSERFLQFAKGVTNTWWDKILDDELFKDANDPNIDDYLHIEDETDGQ